MFCVMDMYLDNNMQTASIISGRILMMRVNVVVINNPNSCLVYLDLLASAFVSTTIDTEIQLLITGNMAKEINQAINIKFDLCKSVPLVVFLVDIGKHRAESMLAGIK